MEWMTSCYNYVDSRTLSKIYEDIIGPVEARAATTLGAVLIRPKSRGTVTLASSSFTDNPIVDFNFYSHPDDIKLMVKGTNTEIEFLKPINTNINTPFQHEY